jgi:hypothetical protein
MTEETRTELNALAEVSLQEVTGLMEYLQSPEALKNARKARERRIVSRPNREPRTPNRTPNPNLEPRTSNPNPAPGTRNRT